MSEIELIKGLKYLGIAYGKEFDTDECKVYYDFLKSYNYDVFRNAIKYIIGNSKFIPKINEIIEACEKQKDQVQFELIEYMNSKGYFKIPLEYEKTINFAKRNIIPGWLREDMKKYYSMMLKEQSENLLGGDTVKLLEG